MLKRIVITTIEFDCEKHEHRHHFCPVIIGVIFTSPEGIEMPSTITIPAGQKSLVTLQYLDANGLPDPGPNPTPVLSPSGVSSDPNTTSIVDNGDGTFSAVEDTSAVVSTSTTLTFTDANGLTGTGTVTCGPTGTTTFTPASIGVSFASPTP